MVRLDTMEDWQWMLGSWMQVYRAAQVLSDDVIYFAFSFGPFLGFWTAFDAAAAMGCLCIPGGGASSVHRLETMIRHRATALCCTPTYALRLAEVAEEHGMDLKSSTVRAIIVAGEPGGSLPGVKERISELWGGARVFDHYGMTEVGPAGYQDPTHPHLLRVIDSRFYAEVVDSESGEAVKPGETGELVLTTLGRIGGPLLRYRTGDLVKLAVPDEEKGVVGFALDGGILGRADDMIIVRGVNIHPGAIDEVVRSTPGIAEYRVHVDKTSSLPELSIEVELAQDAEDDSPAQQLEEALESTFPLRIPVSVVEQGSLPRPEMKAKRWIVKEA